MEAGGEVWKEEQVMNLKEQKRKQDWPELDACGT